MHFMSVELDAGSEQYISKWSCIEWVIHNNPKTFLVAHCTLSEFSENVMEIMGLPVITYKPTNQPSRIKHQLRSSEVIM